MYPTEVIDVAGHACVIGMEWSIQPSRATLREAKKAAGKRAMLIERGSDDGTLLGVAQGRYPRNALPAALAVAAAYGDAIVCHALPDERVWSCVIASATPLPDSDRIVRPDEARALLTEWMSMHPGLDIVGTVNGAATTLEDALRSLEPSAVKAMRMRSAGIPTSTLVSATLVPVLAGVGFLGWQQWNRHGEELRLAADTARAVLMQQDSERERRAKATEAFGHELQRQRDAISRGVVATDQYAQWRNAVLGVTPSHEGYRLESAACTMDPVGGSHCTLTWITGGTHATRAVPASALTLPGTPAATLDTDPNTLLANATSRLGLAPLPVIEIAADPRGMAIEQVSRAQLMGVAMRFNAPAPVVVTPGPDVVGASAVTLGQRGTWTAQAPTLVHADALVESFVGTGLQLKNVRFDGLGGARVRVALEGDYVSEASAAN